MDDSVQIVHCGKCRAQDDLIILKKCKHVMCRTCIDKEASRPYAPLVHLCLVCSSLYSSTDARVLTKDYDGNFDIEKTTIQGESVSIRTKSLESSTSDNLDYDVENFDHPKDQPLTDVTRNSKESTSPKFTVPETVASTKYWTREEDNILSKVIQDQLDLEDADSSTHIPRDQLSPKACKNRWLRLTSGKAQSDADEDYNSSEEGSQPADRSGDENLGCHFGKRWTSEEDKVLHDLVEKEAKVQGIQIEQLRSFTSQREFWESIPANLKQHGYNRTARAAKERFFNNLKATTEIEASMQFQVAAADNPSPNSHSIEVEHQSSDFDPVVQQQYLPTKSRFSERQLRYLKQKFKQIPPPDLDEQRNIAKRLSCEATSVYNWFEKEHFKQKQNSAHSLNSPQKRQHQFGQREDSAFSDDTTPPRDTREAKRQRVQRNSSFQISTGSKAATNVSNSGSILYDAIRLDNMHHSYPLQAVGSSGSSRTGDIAAPTFPASASASIFGDSNISTNSIASLNTQSHFGHLEDSNLQNLRKLESKEQKLAIKITDAQNKLSHLEDAMESIRADLAEKEAQFREEKKSLARMEKKVNKNKASKATFLGMKDMFEQMRK